jgi:hypothetical protein
MIEQANKLAEAFAPPELETARKHNRGWFQPGDARINRRGRPRQGPEAVARRARSGRPLCGNIAQFLLPASDFRQYLTGYKAPWLKNLPYNARFVAVEVDVEQGMFLVTIHSEQFEFVEAGAPIPVFQAVWYGLAYRSRR